MKRRLPWALVLLTVGGTLDAAPRNQQLTSEQRLERIERILQNQSMSEILLQLQQLQQDVRQLRGDLEMQRHSLDTMGKRQRELYLDLDRRLSDRTSPVPVPAGPAVGEAPATPPPVVADSAPAVAHKPGDPAKERSTYQAAFNLLKEGNYAESINAFRDFLGAYPNGEYADNAQYWLGEASYVTRDFDTAQADFNGVLERFPNSPKVAGAMLKIGYIYYEKHAWDSSREMLNRLIKEHPRTTEARLARQRLDRMGR